MADGWIEIPSRLRASDPKKGVASVNEFYRRWKIYIYPFDNDYDLTYFETENGVTVREWVVEVPCICTRDREFLKITKSINVDPNNLIVGCSKCEKQRVKIAGLRTLEWKIWIDEDLKKGITR